MLADAPEAARVRRLLDDPQLRRVFLITDRIETPAEPEVSSLVERTTHHDFFKITVAQGIVIDPDHPGKSTVFAVVLDDSELAPFRERLRSHFADRVTESPADPMIAMQLAQISQVVALPGHPAADVLSPPAAGLAFRDQPEETGPREQAEAPAASAGTSDQERRHSAPVVAQADGSRSQDAPRRRDTGTSAPSSSGLSPPVVARVPSAAARDRSRHRPGDRAATLGDPHRCVVLVWIAGPPAG
jgi:hypothetical protein